MSKLYEPAFADPHYGQIRPEGGYGYTLAAGPGSPSGVPLPAAGYAPGCLYIDRTNAAVYKNVGTLTVAVWEAIPGAGDLVSLAVQQPLVVVPAATTTLTLTPALHAGRIVQVQSTGGLAITPPAATGTGNVYTFGFLATVTGGNFTIDAKAGNASDVFSGYAVQNLLATGLTTTPTASNTNLFTFNGSTKGGILGDYIELIDTALHSWTLWVNGQYTGSFSSPFSNH